jgi:hypothetical protein
MNGELQNLAPDMENMRIDHSAQPAYDLMSDSLVWPDEIPTGKRARELWCLRPMLRYRTGLILGMDISEFRPDWESAKEAFPDWIGFEKERSRRDANLQQIYHRLSKK